MIVYGIKWKCEIPLQMTDNETAQISTIGQGVVSGLQLCIPKEKPYQSYDVMVQ